MKTRIITAIVGIIFLIPFLIFSHTIALIVLAWLLSMFSVYELLKCTGLIKNVFVDILTFASAAVLPAMTRFCGLSNETFISFAFIILFLYMIVILTASVFSKGKIAINDAAMLIVTVMYVLFGICSLVRLRDENHGGVLFILVLLLPWLSDSFAYFSGRAFGKHKLIPDVSPKKTVEGAVGGLIGTMIASVVYGIVCGYIFSLKPEYLFFAVVGLLLSLISQCGDLIMSLIKRHYGIKDYGKLLPGHGGVLDRFDSTIVTASLLYIVSMALPFFPFR